MFCWETLDSGIYVDVSLINTIHRNFAANRATCWWQQPPSAGECTAPHWKLLKNNPGNTAKSIFSLEAFYIAMEAKDLTWKLRQYPLSTYSATVGKENSLLTGRDFGHAQGKNVGKRKKKHRKEDQRESKSSCLQLNVQHNLTNITPKLSCQLELPVSTHKTKAAMPLTMSLNKIPTLEPCE